MTGTVKKKVCIFCGDLDFTNKNGYCMDCQVEITSAWEDQHDKEWSEDEE